MHVDLYSDPAALDDLAPEWEALLPRAVTNTTFLRPFWLKAWWEAYGAGKDLHLLAVRDDGGALVGIAPLFFHRMVVEPDTSLPRLSIERPEPPTDGVERRILHPLGGSEVSDYLDLIVARDVAPAVYEAMWAHLCSGDRTWDLLDLHDIPEDSPTLRELTELAREEGLEPAIEREEVCPTIQLSGSWDDYLANLSKKQRHEIRRKVRKAHREVEVTWRKAEGGESLGDDLALFFRLHEASAPDKAAFWNDETRQFFTSVTATLAAEGSLELSFIYYDDEPVASLYCFAEERGILVYNSGYEPSKYRSLSSGLVLLSKVIEDAIGRGFAEFDFLRGDERYKYNFGGVDSPIYRLGIATV